MTCFAQGTSSVLHLMRSLGRHSHVGQPPALHVRQCGLAGKHLLGPSLQICHPAMFCMPAGSFLGVAGLVVGKWQAIATATAVAFRTFGGPSFFGSILRTPGKPADVHETPAAICSLLDTNFSLLAGLVLGLTSLGCLEARQTKQSGKRAGQHYVGVACEQDCWSSACKQAV